MIIAIVPQPNTLLLAGIVCLILGGMGALLLFTLDCLGYWRRGMSELNRKRAEYQASINRAIVYQADEEEDVEWELQTLLYEYRRLA